MSGQHARLGCSNKRWPHCPGSPREEAQYPDIAGEAAIDGTGSHILLELCLVNNVHALQYDQQIIGVGHEDNPSGWLVGLDRCARVQQCLDYVSRRVQELRVQFPEGTVRVGSETRSNPGEYFHRDDWWGTVDITISVVHSHTNEVLYIEVVDYKDGKMWVTATDNSQLVSYLWGKVHPHYQAKTLRGHRMTIVQPKTNPVIRYTDSERDGQTIDNVETSAVRLATAAAATDDPFAVLIPGKHCQWCAANPKRGGHCTAAADQSLQTVVNMSTEIIPAGGVPAYEYLGQAIADVSQLTEMQLSELSSARAALNAVFDDVDAEIVTRIEAGKHVSGKAMRPGQGSNGWTFDEKTTVKKLKARRLKHTDIYPPKLASPAQILKHPDLTEAQKTRLEKDLVTYTAGKLKLTDVAHTEAPTESKVELMFGDLAAPAVATADVPLSFF